jgi:endonuclease III
MARTTRASAKPPAAKRAKTKTESPWEDVVKPEKNDAKTEAASPSVVDVRDGRAIVVADATTTSPPSSGASPYPTLSRPTPEECWAARDALAHLHAEYYRDFLRRTSLGAVGPGADRGVPALPATPAIGGGGDANAAAVAAVAAVAAAGDADDAAHHPKCVLDSLVGTILSQNTTDVNSARAFARLAATFAPSRDGRGRLNFWETIRAAPSAEVEAAIKCGGLAEIKTSRIKVILNTLVEERGAPCMEYLRDMSDDDVKSELSRFKGVGPKTIACVLVFCLRRVLGASSHWSPYGRVRVVNFIP